MTAIPYTDKANKDVYKNIYTLSKTELLKAGSLIGIDTVYIEQKFDEFFFQILSNLILSDIQQMFLINFDRKLFVMIKKGQYFLI